MTRPLFANHGQICSIANHVMKHVGVTLAFKCAVCCLVVRLSFVSVCKKCAPRFRKPTQAQGLEDGFSDLNRAANSDNHVPSALSLSLSLSGFQKPIVSATLSPSLSVSLSLSLSLSLLLSPHPSATSSHSSTVGARAAPESFATGRRAAHMPRVLTRAAHMPCVQTRTALPRKPLSCIVLGAMFSRHTTE
jgi:hypothetical protein